MRMVFHLRPFIKNFYFCFKKYEEKTDIFFCNTNTIFLSVLRKSFKDIFRDVGLLRNFYVRNFLNQIFMGFLQTF